MGEQVTNIGIVGTGVISGTYLDHLAKLPGVDVVAVADLDLSRAQAIADQHQGIRALSSEDLLADPEVDIVLNLTIPAAHASVNQAALQAGKHVYGEKPLAVDRAEAEPLLKLAAAGNLRIGCARTLCWARGPRPHEPPSTEATSAYRLLRRLRSSRLGTSCGTRRLSSTTSPVAARCSTWARTTSAAW